MPLNKKNVEEFLVAVQRWADNETNVCAVALVGSHARGSARPDSDVDLVLQCAHPTHYLTDRRWLSTFGDIRSTAVEDWGNVQSIRTFYADGMEVEFGLTSVDWVALPLDTGTIDVLTAGATVLFDRDGRLTRAVESVQRSARQER